MSNHDIMAVDERLSRLETTVAAGFHEQGQRVSRLETGLSRLETTVATGFHEQWQRTAGLEGRMARLEDRMFALESKLDVFADAIRGDIKTVLEAVTASTDEMRRTTDAIRKEHEADRRLTRSILEDHTTRIRTLERREPPEMN